MSQFSLRDCKLGVIGLGYVGLPLAVEFGKVFATVGFDIKEARVAELKKGKDSTLEVEPGELKTAKRLSYSTNVKDLRSCTVFIVTVPTPIDNYKRPDLTPIVRASELIGQVLKKGDIVVFESTVYPGCTEEIRLQPGAHQPGRQAAPADNDQENHLRLDAGSRGLRRLALQQHHPSRHAQSVEHPCRRSGEGDREHAA
jgi:nucleotide sugar dehydrogenase